MSSKIECGVCCVEHTNRNIVKCESCDYESCKQCTTRYLLMTDTDPQCMSCKKIWGNDFLSKSFTKKFINTDLKTHRREILYNREAMYFERAQQYAEQEKQKRSAIELYESLKKEKIELLKQLKKLNETIVDVKNNISTGQYNNTDISKKFVSRKCPVDKCRGFMKCEENEEIMKCGLCENKECKLCGEERDSDDHVCDQEKKESLKCILDNSKQCPSCGVQIQKSSGCDQMWCIQCHTTFSYNTGKIEVGRCHNPLYLEWRRRNMQNGRNPDDFACGGLPDKWTIQTRIYEIFGIKNRSLYVSRPLPQYKEQMDSIKKYCNGRNGLLEKIHTVVNTLQYFLRNKYRIDATIDNNKLTTKFLLQEVDVENYKKKLYENEKQFQKNKDIGYCVHFASHAFVDLFQRMLICKTKTEIDDIIKEMVVLKVYYNRELIKVSNRYGNLVVPVINEKWELISGKS